MYVCAYACTDIPLSFQHEHTHFNDKYILCYICTHLGRPLLHLPVSRIHQVLCLLHSWGESSRLQCRPRQWGQCPVHLQRTQSVGKWHLAESIRIHRIWLTFNTSQLDYFVGSCGPTHPSHPMISSTTLVLRYGLLKSWLPSNSQQLNIYVHTCIQYTSLLPFSNGTVLTHHRGRIPAVYRPQRHPHSPTGHHTLSHTSLQHTPPPCPWLAHHQQKNTVQSRQWWDRTQWDSRHPASHLPHCRWLWGIQSRI